MYYYVWEYSEYGIGYAYNAWEHINANAIATLAKNIRPDRTL